MTSIIRPSIKLCQQRRWHPYASSTLLEIAAVQTIQVSASKSIETRNAFHIVLSGGNTPRRVYELLQSIKTEWHLWHIYFGDERCLPKGHSERNSTMASEAWLNHVDIPASQIHIIPTEQGPDRSAVEYAHILNNIDLFDLVILGLGEDGHTASLFPNHDLGVLPDSPATLVIQDAPKPPSERVSLSAHRLGQTRQLIFLVSGLSKRQAVMDWHLGKKIPAAMIRPECDVDIYIEDKLISEF